MSFLPFSHDKQTVADININLVPKDDFFNTFVGKTLRWALSVGRYIVIFTELVVILSFIARFSLDRQLADLNESINQKSTIINSYGDLEKQVRIIQAKTSQYQQIEQNSNLSDVFPALTEITPRGVLLEELKISPNDIVMSGQTDSQASLNILINNLQLSPDFFNVTVSKIETRDDTAVGFAFQISADTKEAVKLREDTTSNSTTK